MIRILDFETEALDLEKVSKVDLFNATWNDMGLSGHREISENCDFSIFSPKNQPTLNDFKQKLASAEESLKKGIFSRTKTERIRSLHFGLLTLRGMDLREGLSEDDLYNTRHWSQCPITKKILEKSKILSVNLRLELIKQLILSKDKSWSRILQISEEILVIDDKNIMALKFCLSAARHLESEKYYTYLTRMKDVHKK